MSEFIVIGRNTEAVPASEVIYDEVISNMQDGETSVEVVEDLAGQDLADETETDIVEDAVATEGEIIIDDGAYIDPGFTEGEYIDPGFYEGGYMEPGMEMGMGEVKEPLLSSWPFVIGISAAIFVVSIALGALLAKLKIKKGLDLYED